MGRGMKRKIDKLGRVVVPKSLRNALGVDLNEEISMTLSENKIIITKASGICTLCNKGNPHLQVNDSQVCKACYKKIKSFEP